MDWVAIGDTVKAVDWTVLSNIAVVISALFLAWQLIETRRTTQSQAYSAAIEHLQDEKVRKARQAVFQLKGRPLENWTSDEIGAAEVVCHTYDAIGQMVRYRLLSKKIIISSWGPSLRRSWPIVRPLVEKYRQEFDALEYWDDYEWLANEAHKAKRR